MPDRQSVGDGWAYQSRTHVLKDAPHVDAANIVNARGRGELNGIWKDKYRIIR